MSAAGEMRAAVWRGGRFAIETQPRPEPAAGEALVRLRACGICGTDLHLHHLGVWAEGHTPGHEMTGVVETLGDGAVGPAPGTPVAIEPLRGCGECACCRAGQVNICPRVQLFGVHVPGGFAEHIAVPAERLHPVPADIPVEIAALAEPLAVCVHGLRRGRLEPGQRVLVLGAGTIGLLGVLVARALGAGEVWISARHPHQAEMGRALGATRVLSEAEADPAAIGAAAGDAAIDLVLESVGGRANTLRAALAAVRPGGAISVLGLFDGEIALPAFPLLLKEGSLLWSNCYAQGPPRSDFADAIGILTEQRDALAPLLSRSLPLCEVEDAFALASDKQSGAVKVTLRLEP
jgi:threonine dehydrogenase-like Zn-dependent dehydrogenase